MFRRLRSIQIQLPLLLLLVGVLSIASLYQYLLRHEIESHRAETVRSLNAAGTRLAALAEYLLQRQDTHALHTTVYLTGQFPDLTLAAVIDGQGRILHATQQSWQRRLLADSPFAVAASQIDQSRSTLSGRWGEFDKGHLMIGTYAFQMPIKTGDLGAGGIGIVAMGIDLTNRLLAARQEARRIATVASGALLLVTLLLWYALHRLLTRPVQALVRTTRAFSEGDYDTSANIASGNEMGEISTALDTMVNASREREMTQATNLRLAQIVESSVNEIYVTDAVTYQIIVANRIARENLGYSDNEVLQLYPWSFVQDLTEQNIQQMIAPLVDGTIEVIEFETRHVRKNGSIYPVSTRLQYLSHLNPPVFCAIVQDITELQEQQAALMLRNRAMAEVDVGVLITDATQDDNPIVYVNAAIEQMSGFNADELVGRNPRVLQGDDRDQPELKAVRQAISEEKPIQTVLRNYRKDGSQFMDEVSISPVRDPNGTVTHFIGIQRDVTERLATDARLLQSRKIDAIGQLSGGIAHDFNNLLTVITGNLELLQMDLNNPELNEFVEEAGSAAKMGARLTRRLLAFARQGILEPVVLNVNHQVLSALELLQSTIGETITLSSDLSQELWTIKADPSEIENTVVNLAINARDAMPGGGEIKFETANVQLEISARHSTPDLPPGDYIRLSVADTGCGMPDEVKSRIFEPFFTTKAEGKGTGLGLASIHGFARQSGGEITVESEPGAGTTFNIYLPRCVKDDEALTDKDINPVSDSTHQGRILIVEDNKLVRNLTAKRLKSLGFESLSAKDGPTAVKLLETESDIDLVLSDVVMDGGMSGYDVAQWVQANRPHCRLLLTSGFSEQEAEDVGISNDRFHFLSKPYSVDELKHALSDAFSNGNADA